MTLSFTAKDKSIDELLCDWDRDKYFQFARRLEILLMRRYTSAAVDAVRQYDAWMKPEPPTLASLVGDVLPIRIARVLETHGYETLQSVAAVSDSELLVLPNFGDVSLRIVRAAQQAAKQGIRLHKLVIDQFPDLAPEWEIDWEFLKSFEGENRVQRE